MSLSCWQWLTSQSVHTECLLVSDVSFLDFNEGVLGVETGILGQSAGNDQQSFSEAHDSKLGLSGNFLGGSAVLSEMLMGCDLEGASSWNDSFVFNSVLDGTETITDGVLSLSDGVIVRSLDKDGAREWVLNTLNEGVFVLTEVLLVDELGETEVALLNIVDGVDLLTTAGEGNSLTVSSLGTSDANDVVAGEDLEGRRVNTLLVDNDKVLVGAITELLLELNDLQNAVISELTLRFDQLLSLIGIAPEESGVDLGLFVLKRDVEAHDVAVLQTRGHVALSATVVEDKTANQLRLSGHLVLHVHDFDHMEIDLIIAHNSFGGIGDEFSTRVGDRCADLGVKRAAGDANEEVSG